MKNLKQLVLPVLLSSALGINSAQASVLEIHFTGQFTLVDPFNVAYSQSAIDSVFTYDTVGGVGSSDLFISPFSVFGFDATFHDISMDRIDGTDLILGNMLVDWADNFNMPVSTIWDATGLFNAIDYGLVAGDVISGTDLIRGGNTIYDVQSATPAADATGFIQGPAPIASTTFNTEQLCTTLVDCINNPFSGGENYFDDFIAGSPMVDGPFVGVSPVLDIGSGNSLTVLSVSSVPVPAAVWLFGSGLIGLIGFARRK